MKKILIDTSFTSTTDLNTGIQRVVRKIIENIDSVASSSNYTPIQVILQEDNIIQFSTNQAIEVQEGDILLLLDSTWHLDTWGSIRYAKSQGAMIVAVIYDIIPISHSQFCDANLVKLFKEWFSTSINYVDGFIAISQTVQNDLKNYLTKTYPQEVKSKFFDHFLLGADFKYTEFDIFSKKTREDLVQLYSDKQKSIYLIVCTVEPRKNHTYLLDAFDKLWNQNIDVTLTIVGKTGWMVDDLMARIHNHPNYNKKLFHFDNLNDEELNYCYKNSKMLLFPSFVEGFGLPIIESLNNHLPVMASDTPIHKEVGGKNIGYFDLNNPQDLTNKILHIEKTSIPKSLQIKKGFKWLNWEQSTQILFEKVQKFDKKFIPTSQTPKAIQTPKKSSIKQTIKKIPLLGWFLRWSYNILRLNNIKHTLFMQQTTIQNLQNQTMRQAQQLIESQKQIDTLLHFNHQNTQHINNQSENIKTQAQEITLLKQILNTKVNTQTITQTINKIHAELKSELETKVNTQTINKIHAELKSELNIKADNQALKSIETKLTTNLNNKADYQTLQKLESTLISKADLKHFEVYLQAVNYAKEYMQLLQRDLNTLVTEAKNRLPKETLSQEDLKTIAQTQEHKFDSFYVEFEDKFRGTKEEIKSRVAIYLPYIKNLIFDKEQTTILDLACGRGEWLELLKENGYNNIAGVDLNRVMVSLSKPELNVKEQDLFMYLNTLKDETQAVVSGFHIIEHLPFELLMQLFEESLRVLKKGGIVIFETPNPENVFVGTSNFYTDPTHKNPIPPVTAEFILQQLGYTNVSIKRISREDIHYEDPNINHLFASATDYAVIGYKS